MVSGDESDKPGLERKLTFQGYFLHRIITILKHGACRCEAASGGLYALNQTTETVIFAGSQALLLSGGYGLRTWRRGLQWVTGPQLPWPRTDLCPSQQSLCLSFELFYYRIPKSPPPVTTTEILHSKKMWWVSALSTVIVAENIHMKRLVKLHGGRVSGGRHMHKHRMVW